jgi:phospholipid/cholesterol/gamma-HCH transport system permease protein
MRYEDRILYVEGTVDRDTVPELLAEFRRLRVGALEAVDLAQVRRIDSAGVAFLHHVLRHAQGDTRFRGASEEVQSAIELFSPPEPTTVRDEREGLAVRVGERLVSSAAEAGRFLLLAADTVVWSMVGVVDTSMRPRGEVLKQCYLLGVRAVPVIGLLSLIIGLIIALQSAVQLRQFGAGTFIVDLVGLSMTREMGPMMTAVIIAGRSGSAIAAEVATMRVTEELDALEVMALAPVRYVVVPKFLAMTTVIPVLTAFSVMVGIGGGMAISAVYLRIAPVTFLRQLVDVLTVNDLVIGILKSLFFGWAIVLVASHFGMLASGGAEGVGRATTQSVVASIFAVILLNAMFSLMYLV